MNDLNEVQKAYEITNAKIQFVSLVDKAANNKQFLITKAKNGQATFSTCGRIVKADASNHYLTGIVYEPMVEDVHGNYMTEEEITKAAYYFTKNGNSVDIQHSFEPLESAVVVENWVAKSDFKIGNEEIKKGTWLMTVEVNDENVWDAVQKGEITGFSMGGVGAYSEEDIDLDNVAKEVNDDRTEKKGLFKKLANLFGMDVVEKGAMKDDFYNKAKSALFWNAFQSLEDLLYRYNWDSDKCEFESDEAVIKEALEEFSSILQNILSEKSITKALATEQPIKKSGKKISGKNKDTLQGIYDNLGTLISEFSDNNDEEKEETEVTKSEVEKIVTEAIAKSLNSEARTPAEMSNEPNNIMNSPAVEITQENIEKMVEETISKALTPPEETLTSENIVQMINEQVAKAIEPVLKSRGVPSNLSDGQNIQKSEEHHYLHGVL